MCKKATDAKSRGRTKNQVKNHEKLNYANGGTQERKINSIKRFFHLQINGSTQEKKFNFMKKYFE